MQKYVAKHAAEGLRADVFVAKRLGGFARSSLKRLFRQSQVLINGSPAKASRRLHFGDRVAVDTASISAKPPFINLPVLYEDQDVVVINKPAGLLSHAKGGLNLEPSVASFLTSKITDKNLHGNRFGVVHRLDRATSGVIIGAKSQESQKKLQEQFAGRSVKKTYLAIVNGEPKPAEAIIDAPIGRNPKKPQTFRVSARGKSARSRYRVKKTFHRHNQTYSLLELEPTTGRTHQLRVHLAYIGHPIVGDKIYGHQGAELLLHASALELTLPNGSRRLFKAPMPARISEFINEP